MPKEEELKQLKSETQKLKRFLLDGEMPSRAFLQEFCELVEVVTLDAGLVCEEYRGYKESYEMLASGFDSLSALGSFRAQETMPEQWAVEHKGSVVASGASLIEAAHGLGKHKSESGDLASIVSAEL